MMKTVIFPCAQRCVKVTHRLLLYVYFYSGEGGGQMCRELPYTFNHVAHPHEVGLVVIHAHQILESANL